MGNLLRTAPPPEVPQPGHVIGHDGAPGSRRASVHAALDEIDLSINYRTPRKRKKGQAFDVSFDDGADSKMTTPTRKKLKNTARYIYETLFENGQDSDVTITALGKSWRLHKVYLCQSAYFNSMFSGNWVESNRREIDIEVPDPNVTREALEVALGSLYRDEVSIKPVDTGSILAAASLLQLDSLIQHCEDVMKDNIGPQTVTEFFDAAVTYGIPALRQECFSWLLKNLMTSPAEFLAGISEELMTELVDNADLFVMQVEMDVYTLLKKWVFLKLRPDWLRDNRLPATVASSSSSSSSDPSSAWTKSLAAAAEMHLATLVASSSSSSSSSSPSLLEGAVGRHFARVFRRLRFQHIVNDLNSLDILEKERIIPSSWLTPLIPAQWRHLLRLETELDGGPSAEEVSTEDFRRCCLRCGRILLQDVDHCWRWTGFHFGVDLLISYQKRQITIKRNTGSHKCLMSVSLHPKRNLVLCVSVGSLEPQSGRLLYEKSSAVTHLSLAPDEERVVLGVDRHAPFPLHVSVKMLFYTPTEADLKWAEATMAYEGEEEEEVEEEDEEEPAEVKKDGDGGGEKGEEAKSAGGENPDRSAGEATSSKASDSRGLKGSSSSSSSVRRNLTRSFNDDDDDDDDDNSGNSTTPNASAPRVSSSSPRPSLRSPPPQPSSPQSLRAESSASVIRDP